MRQPQAPRQELRNQHCLVVDTFPFTLLMERYWNEDIRSELLCFAVDKHGRPVCKPGAQRRDLLEFQ